MLSSIEAEYMALYEATQETVWLRAFMRELTEDLSENALKMYKNNQGAIALAKFPNFTNEPNASTFVTSLCTKGLKWSSGIEILSNPMYVSRHEDESGRRCPI